MKNKKRAVAVAVAAILACGALAGCDSLITTNVGKDYRQVIAEVDITRSADFESGGKYAAYKDLVGKANIIKRDMVASFVASGYSYMNSYNLSYAETFRTIAESLVNRQVFIQFGKVYLAANGGLTESEVYTVDGYKKAVEGDFASDAAREAAGLAYFLTEEERDKAVYDLRVSINSSIDSLEDDFIKADEDETSSVSVRTLPTDAETENEDYYDNDYAIYTGKETALGSYEKKEGSTPTTRRNAYTRYLASLRSNDLLEEGEDTSKIESINYFAMELKSAYESAIIGKVSEKFEKEAEEKLTEAWAKDLFDSTLAAQKESFAKDKSSFETALDGMSDTSFVFAPYDTNYGFVINILLPFSTTQTQELDGFTNDFNDAKGAKYAARAKLLEKVVATDQRESWFTGATDYSYVAEEADGAFTGGDAARKYLFFENGIKNAAENADGSPAKYEKLENYYGKYTFNGTAEKDDDGKYTVKATPITIDGFLKEMKDYLAKEGLTVTNDKTLNESFRTASPDYFTRTDYTEGAETAGEVNYDNFIYEMGKLTAFEEAPFDANRMFVDGTNEYKAFSIINELSFAYNTDTAGLNDYLGYSVSPFKTDYMSEFEYAAQIAVASGAGTYCVVPTDYGWHIIYCTFSFADTPEGADTPFAFDYEEREGGTRETENSFSYSYFEQLKSAAVGSYATNKQQDAINTYVDACSNIYSERFKDLSSLGN